MGHQQVALNSLLTTLPNRNFIASTVAALYYTAVELEISKKVTDKQTHRETHISITEATLILWIAGLSGPTNRDFNY